MEQRLRAWPCCTFHRHAPLGEYAIEAAARIGLAMHSQTRNSQSRAAVRCEWACFLDACSIRDTVLVNCFLKPVAAMAGARFRDMMPLPFMA